MTGNNRGRPSPAVVGGHARLAIDFGTSHTVAVCQWDDGDPSPLLFDASPLLPSAVLADSHGSLLVGRDAQRGSRSDPAAFEPQPKRRIDERSLLLGRVEVPVAEAIAAVLRRCLDEAKRVAGHTPGRVMLTHPAAWGPRRRAVLLDAADRAGVPMPALLAEPNAAALYFGGALRHDAGPRRFVAVYDFGGGTFDVSVLRQRPDNSWEVVATDGLDDLGGVELDALIVDRAGAALRPTDPGQWRRLTEPATPADIRARQMLWEEARSAKEQLSRATAADLHVPIFDIETHLTRDEFEDLARPSVERTVALTAATLTRAGVRSDQLAGLFLVGGSSRIPMVASMLHHRLGIPPTVIEQPELVVAQGALRSVVAQGGTSRPVRVGQRPGQVGQDDTPIVSAVAIRPSPSRWLRRYAWIAAAGITVAVIAFLLQTDWKRDASPELNAVGQRNAAVFKTPALREFARAWLNDVSVCEQRTPDTYGGVAFEYVACDGNGWEVQFRALESVGERDRSRRDRVEREQGTPRSFTGTTPSSGQRVDYFYETDRVIYWDDDASGMVGDLTTAELDHDQLAAVWEQHVRAT